MSTSIAYERDTLASTAARSAHRAAEHLLALQQGGGYWCADLTADTTLESDYILLQLWMFPPDGAAWTPPTRTLIDKAVRSILARQLPDGGFNIYAKGPSEISATVKAYFALKVAGLAPDDERMARARERILELGGIQAANSYVKINLSLFDMYPRQYCPSIPPEVMLLPGKFLYQMSAWTRAIVVSLAIVHSSNPRRPVPAGFNLDELYKPGVSLGFHRSDALFTWRNAFLGIDRFLKFWERHGWRALRQRALQTAEQWMLARCENSDGLGAIYPPMMYAIMALDVLGYPPDHPASREARHQFDRLMIDDGRRFLFQPCFSPIWDTGIAGFALGEAAQALSGAPSGPGLQPGTDDALRKAAGWILSKEVRVKGDWSVKRPRTEPSGWGFFFRNDHYPDIDDTAMILLALSRAQASDRAAQEACHKRALNWIQDMQGRDGGWAAFDVDNNWEFLNNVPFADHNAMLDPACPDITGRVLEALGAHGLGGAHPAVKRGVDFLISTQLPDGSWYGRWGVAYIYGTCFALRGLRASGYDDREAGILRAGEWLRSIQNADGGWGESCSSYDRGFFVPAESTPSQTAWALMGLIAGGDTNSLSVNHGIEYLLERQRPEGGWDEELATGTGFPRVFYLNYHYYRLYFPLIALAEFVKSSSSPALAPGAIQL
ncbi:MAG TPA: squalene--hopene cyclase [Bryobacteraceae bacterium]|nr:squalene--hopene cyclase [Bryobacteraceae bacterium]